MIKTNKKKITLFKIIKYLNLKKNKNLDVDFEIKNVSNIQNSTKGDLTFCSNFKYLNYLKKTKSSACLINKNFIKFLPKTCVPVTSSNPEIDFIKISNLFYSDYSLDTISSSFLTAVDLKKKYKKLFYGNNFVCENNVKIGKNVQIGHNVVLKNNTVIHDNVIIGSNVIISNAIIEKKVNICDGTVIGKKGFGFKFFDGKLLRIPHIGKVIIKENAEIGSNCNIDRGSISDTIIGKYTFLDNQIQIAHNVKIGDYCMIAAQVGISGSTIIGNNVSIGGQSGISGHLKIGNNVKIGGKSGVIKNVGDNKILMGYPAVEFREFVKKNKK